MGGIGFELEGGAQKIVEWAVCPMIFLSPFQDVTRMSIVSFFAQLDS